MQAIKPIPSAAIRKVLFQCVFACAFALLVALTCVPAVALAAQDSLNADSTAPLSLRAQVKDRTEYKKGAFRVIYEKGEVGIVKYLGSKKKVQIPSSVKLGGKSYPVVEVLGGAFEGASITSVSVPSSVDCLDPGAFYKCKSLKKVTGCKGLMYIGYCAFYGCPKLASFPFGKKLELIESKAFAGTKIKTSQYPTTLAKDESGDYRACTAVVKIKGKECYTYAYRVLALVNKERKKRGLHALVMDKDLLKAAMQRASELWLVLSHARPNAESYTTACPRKLLGENIALFQSTPEKVVNSWMSSSGHRANILKEAYKSIGIGCFEVDGFYAWTQAFGVCEAEKASKPKDKTATHAIAYSNRVGDLVFEMQVPDVSEGESAAIKIECAGMTVEPDAFKYTSSDKAVATVDSKGRVKGIKGGKAKITAKAKRGTLKISETVTVG